MGIPRARSGIAPDLSHASRLVIRLKIGRSPNKEKTAKEFKSPGGTSSCAGSSRPWINRHRAKPIPSPIAPPKICSMIVQ